MSQEQWTAVDRYVTDTLVGRDAALDAALEASVAAGLPPINVSPPQGKLLHVLARLSGSRAILEVGTLGGYSTIWLARAFAGRRPPDHARSGTRTRRSGVGQHRERRPGRSRGAAAGPALETLPRLQAEGRAVRSGVHRRHASLPRADGTGASCHGDFTIALVTG